MDPPIVKSEIVGRGPNLRSYDHAIICDAGYNTDATLDAAVVLTLHAPLRSLKILAEFRGYCETRWESPGVIACRAESDGYRIIRTGKVFQHLHEVVFESKDDQPLTPSESAVGGGSLAYPFQFVLPRTQIPPTFESLGGSNQYTITCTIIYQKYGNDSYSTIEVTAPVIMGIPDAAKRKMLESSSQLTHQVDPSEDRVGYTLLIPRRVVVLGDSLEVNLAIRSTPGTAKLRYMTACLKPVISFINQQQVGAYAKAPRSLSEMAQSFPLISIGEDDAAPIYRKLLFLVDPELAHASFESPLISAKTVFRLEITLDNSDTPNVAFEVPIVVVPPVRHHVLNQSQKSRPVTPVDVYRMNINRKSYGYSPVSGGASRRVSALLPVESRLNSSVGSKRNSLQSVSSRRRYSSNVASPHPGPSGFKVSSASDGMDVDDTPTDSGVSSLSHQNGERILTEVVGVVGEGMALPPSWSIYDESELPNPSWSISRVAEWVQLLGATRDVADRFVAQAVDGAVLLSLSEDDLKEELGVEVLGLRRRILMGIRGNAGSGP